MTNELSSRQVCFIMAAYGAVLKLLLYPAFAASVVGCDIIFPAALNLALQSAAVWSAAYASSRTQKTIFTIISERCGKGVCCAVAALFALYFLLCALVPMQEQQLLVHDAFYDTVASLYLFIPVFFFLVYAGAKGLRCAGRCADLSFPVFAFCIVAFIIMSAGQGDYSNLLPVFRQPVKTLAGGAVSSAFRFSDSAVMLMLVGRFKYKKGDAAKITLSYAGGGVVVLIMLALYYALYGALAPSRSFLFNSISAFFPAINYVGRLDLLLVYAVDIVVLFAIALQVGLSVECLKEAFFCKNSALLSLAANGVLLLAIIVLNNRFAAVQRVAARWFWLPCLIFSYLAPTVVHFFIGRADAGK